MSENDLVGSIVEGNLEDDSHLSGVEEVVSGLLATFNEVVQTTLGGDGELTRRQQDELLRKYRFSVVRPLIEEVKLRLEGGLLDLIYTNPIEGDRKDEILGLTAREFMDKHSHIHGSHNPIRVYVRSVAYSLVMGRGHGISVWGEVSMVDVLGVSRQRAQRINGIGEITVDKSDIYLRKQYGLHLGYQA
tara:strand:- start:207 stop:773 length:567 start_codon:yes stop_codon:yes gene_type:complete